MPCAISPEDEYATLPTTVMEAIFSRSSGNSTSVKKTNATNEIRGSENESKNLRVPTTVIKKLHQSLNLGLCLGHCDKKISGGARGQAVVLLGKRNRLVPQKLSKGRSTANR